MRYLRVYLGATAEPGITLYEVDRRGLVYRHVEIMAEGARFAPEEVLLLQVIDVHGMIRHPAAEEIDREAFEGLWREVAASRPLCATVPDADLPWLGCTHVGGRDVTLRWLPDAAPERGWTAVPGAPELQAFGDALAARAVARAVFLGTPISWELLVRQAA
jgi:hypothetical protein